MINNQNIAENLNRKAAGTSLDERLRLVSDELEGRLVFTTSFGIEDQVVTQAIADNGLDIELVTLDTGRLFAETYELWAETEQRYSVRIKPFYPKAELLEPLIAKQGINGFYESLAERKGCCDIRKVEPLARSLAGATAWVTGLRAQQSNARGGIPFAELDEGRGLVKTNPLHDWNREMLLARVNAHNVPYNKLHDRGFLSIGCQPCTRAVRLGEDERAGRWWWEQSDQECGLHVDHPERVAASSTRTAA